MLTPCFEVQEKLTVFRSIAVFVFPAVVKFFKNTSNSFPGTFLLVKPLSSNENYFP